MMLFLGVRTYVLAKANARHGSLPEDLWVMHITQVNLLSRILQATRETPRRNNRVSGTVEKEGLAGGSVRKRCTGKINCKTCNSILTFLSVLLYQ